MLITRWLRTRSLNYRTLCSSEHTTRQCFHSTPVHHHNASPHSQTVRPLYLDTIPPTSEQIYASEIFFRTHVPTKSWTATEWRQQPHSESNYLIPEVAFLGRSNSGKSSLLNGLLFDDQLCRVGAKPGKTITMHAWSLSPINPETRGARKGHQGDVESKLTVLDMPGYGHGSHGEWGTAIMKYLTARRQLRRVFVLVNPLHGLKEQDLQMLELLRGHGIPHQMIACKSDKMRSSDAPTLLNDMQRQIDEHFSKRRQVPLLITVRDILTIGGLAQTKDNSQWLESAQGLPDVRWAILRAAGLEGYAMTLAANGGTAPKAKRQPTPSNVIFSDQDVPSKQIGSQQEMRLENHMLVSPSQSSFIPQSTPSIGISVENLLSETHNSSPNSSDSSNLSTMNQKSTSGIDRSTSGRASIHDRSLRSHRPPTRSGLDVKPRAKTQDDRSSRMKDVKRYGGRKR